MARHTDDADDGAVIDRLEGPTRRHSDRRADNLPSREAVDRARQAVRDWSTEESIGAGTARILRQIGLPVASEDVLLEQIEVTDGRPRHGAMMSGAHVSRLVVEAPLERMSVHDGEIPDECPTCGDDRGEWSMSRTHNIAGSRSAHCALCGEELHSDQWG